MAHSFDELFQMMSIIWLDELRRVQRKHVMQFHDKIYTQIYAHSFILIPLSTVAASAELIEMEYCFIDNIFPWLYSISLYNSNCIYFTVQFQRNTPKGPNRLQEEITSFFTFKTVC